MTNVSDLRLSLAVFEDTYRPSMEIFCIHEKDEVPATQESCLQCGTERLHRELLIFVTWYKKKN